MHLLRHVLWNNLNESSSQVNNLQKVRAEFFGRIKVVAHSETRKNVKNPNSSYVPIFGPGGSKSRFHMHFANIRRQSKSSFFGSDFFQKIVGDLNYKSPKSFFNISFFYYPIFV